MDRSHASHQRWKVHAFPWCGRIAYGLLPLGSQIAKDWAKEYKYPLDDTGNLESVATYLAVQHDPMYPKDEILEQWFQNPKLPDFTNPDEPHIALARLPLPIYITTNYDRFMTKALESVGRKPHRALCRWNDSIDDKLFSFDKDSGLEPNPDEPVVFHLHGHDESVESLVLTRDVRVVETGPSYTIIPKG